MSTTESVVPCDELLEIVGKGLDPHPREVYGTQAFSGAVGVANHVELNGYNLSPVTHGKLRACDTCGADLGDTCEDLGFVQSKEGKYVYSFDAKAKTGHLRYGMMWSTICAKMGFRVYRSGNVVSRQEEIGVVHSLSLTKIPSKF